MTEDLLTKSALQLKALMTAREVSPVEVVEASLARLEAVEDDCNAFVTVTAERALEAARRAEVAYGSGDAPPLAGLPVSIKDVVPVKDVKLAFGSHLFADNIAGLDAPVAERLDAAGACLIGKTTTDEFGCKATGKSPLTGQTANPWDLAKTPGGSSAGAGTSVAACVTPFSVGTDGGGSVRIPASCTNLFAIKAHFARVPVFPAVLAPTLFHIGPMSRTVRDAALLLSALAGHDARDPFSVAEPLPDFVAACDAPVADLRIAWSPTLGFAQPDREVVEICEAAVRTFEAHGCEVELVDEVFEEDPFALWQAEFYAGAGTKLKQAVATRAEVMDPAVCEVLREALAQSLDGYYAKVYERYELHERFRRFMEDYDLLATPTLPVPPFDVGHDVPPQMPDASIISWVQYPYPFNLTGNPAASVPAGFTADGLPVGLQLVARGLREVDIFRASAALETARPWDDRRPQIG